MGLFKKIGERLALRKEEKTLREMAELEVIKKQNREKQEKEFHKMLDMELPCKQIVELKNENTGHINFYLLDSPAYVIKGLLNCDDDSVIYIQQLTGDDVGKLYSGTFKPNLDNDIWIWQNRGDVSKLNIIVNNYRNECVDATFKGKNELENKFGETITIGQLYMLYKAKNGQMMDVTFEEDYDSVKKLNNSRDEILYSEEQEV